MLSEELAKVLSIEGQCSERSHSAADGVMHSNESGTGRSKPAAFLNGEKLSWLQWRELGSEMLESPNSRAEVRGTPDEAPRFAQTAVYRHTVESNSAPWSMQLLSSPRS